MQTAEIVAIGTELLRGDIADTNSQLLGKAFARHGIIHLRRTTVGDNLERSTDAIREALGRADVVVTIGGLGPTPDDLTREAIAAATGDGLIHDPDMETRIRHGLKMRNQRWVDSLARQAMRPGLAAPVPNNVGTADGLIWRREDKVVVALPGPRAELLPMLEGAVGELFDELGEGVFLSRTLRIVGIPEASVAETARDLLDSENPTVAPYAKKGEVQLRITARAATKKEAGALIAPLENTLRLRFGKACFGADDEDLVKQTLDLLVSRKMRLAVAESCTGGYLGYRITSIEGSSAAFLGGFVTYSNDMKARELGVAKVDLASYGAVSETVARQMAEGAVRKTGADFALAITGIAGPGGASEEKPQGLVFVALAGPRGSEVTRELFTGDRENIRFLSTQKALEMLYKELMSA